MTPATQIGGPGYNSPKTFVGNAAPVATNDLTTGVDPGDHFVDQTNNRVYICISAAAGAAVWNITAPTTGLVATGTNQGTALGLMADTNVLATVAASTGVVLPPATIGRKVTIYNNGANAAKVYGNSTDTIDGVAAATGVTLSSTKRCQYECVAAGTWISAQFGVTSA